MPKFCDQCGAAVWGHSAVRAAAEGPAAAPPPPPFGAATPPPGVASPSGTAAGREPVRTVRAPAMPPPPPGPVGRSRKRSPLVLMVGIIGAGLAAITLVLILSGGRQLEQR